MLLGRDTSKRISWIQLFLEALIVVLSVLLALALNNWKQNAINEELAQQALHNFEREVRANRSEVEQVFPYHLSLLDTLRSENPPLGINSRMASIQNNAWETALVMGAVPYMDFSVVSIASQIQETQRQYHSAAETSMDIMIRGTFGAGGEGFSMDRIPAGLKIIVAQLAVLEKKLLEQYNEALERIEA